MASILVLVAIKKTKISFGADVKGDAWMKLFTTAVTEWFGDDCCDVKYLDMWHEAPRSYIPDQVVDQSWHSDHDEIVVAKNADGRLLQKAANLLLHYQFYPQTTLSHLGDFDLGNGRAMRVGDRIVQRIHVLQLFGYVLLDVIGIIEISQITSEPRCKGFTYVTVAPHVEQGEGSAHIYWRDNDDLVLIITSISRPVSQEPARNHAFIRAYQKKVRQAGITQFKKLLLAPEPIHGPTANVYASK